MKKKPFVQAMGLAIGMLAAQGVNAEIAEINIWSTNGGRWDSAANWSQGRAPGPGDIAYLGHRSDGMGVVQYASDALPSGALAGFMIDSPSTSPISFQQSGFRFATATEVVGKAGSGGVSLLAGTHEAGTLTLGAQAGGTGNFLLYGGALSAGDENIGLGGIGLFRHSGGSHTVAGRLALGVGAGASGTYELSGDGQLKAARMELGRGGQASFSQSGGTVAVSGALTMGEATGAAAYLLGAGTLSAGSLTVGQGSGNSLDRSTASFRQDGGAVTVANGLTVGYFGVDSASYVLNGGTLAAGQLWLGQYGSGGLHQNGGALTVAREVVLGAAYNAMGFYQLAGGSLDAARLVVGDNGWGDLHQQNGSVRIAQDIVVGQRGTARGRWQLNGGSVEAAMLTVGEGGNGTLSQRGGSVKVAGTLTVAGGYGGTGWYELDGGTLSTAHSHIALQGDGAMRQSTGMHTVAGTLSVGSRNAGGSYLLSGDGRIDARTVHISRGAFNQFGGSVSAAQFSMGEYHGSADYLLDQGSLTAHDMLVGAGSGSVTDSFKATFRQDGGSVAVANRLIVGYHAGSDGMYVLNGGALGARSASIGFTGSGWLQQNGGTFTLAEELAIATDGSWAGGLELNGGGISAASLTVGRLHQGRVQQSGGSLQVKGAAILGGQDRSQGDYTMQGGALAAQRLVLGERGQAVFHQFGGTVSLEQGMLIGAAAGSSGRYRLNAGRLSVGSIDAGAGEAAFEWTGGSLHLDGVARVGGNSLFGQQLALGGAKILETRELLVDAGAAVAVGGAHGQALTASGTIGNEGRLVLADAAVAAGAYQGGGVIDATASSFAAASYAIGGSGYLTGDAGTVWRVGDSFANASSRYLEWNTAASSLVFVGAGDKTLSLAGAERGFGSAGYLDNFAFGSLSLAAGARLAVLDGNDLAGAALYLGLLELGGGLAQLADIHSSYNIYYDASLAGNAYLHGQRYALDGGGYLQAAAPVPEPAGWALMLAGLGVTGMLARRQRRQPAAA